MAREGDGQKRGRASTVDMTSGPILPAIALFSLPILVTFLFQQLYVTIDGMILGRFVGNVALAAVSNCGYLTATIVCFFNGVSVGAGVVLAQLFGARDHDRFGRAVWAAGFLALASGLVLTVASIVLARPCLSLMNLSGEVLDQAVLYMVVYAFSSLPMTVYNMGCAVFRSFGDSRTPMAILAVSSLANVGLALLFVVAWGWGVFGAALGAVFAQLIAGVLTCLLVWRRRRVCCIEATRPSLDRRLLRWMLSIGLPSGVQVSVLCASSIFISARINTFGLEVMGGFGAYSKIDGWFYLPAEAVQAGIMTFVGQNLGARRYARARHAVRRGLVLNVLVMAALCAIVYLFRYPVIGLFSSDPAVVEAGVQALATIVPLYFLYAAYCALGGLFDGVGSTRVPMVLSLLIMCVARIVWIYTAGLAFPSPVTIYLSYPVTWVAIVAASLVYAYKGSWNHARDIRGSATEGAEGV